MKKIINLSFWLSFSTVLLLLIYNSYITQTDFYYRYKYGILYNKVRNEKCIPELPKRFIVLKDKCSEPLLTWVNPEFKLSSSHFTHIKKILTIRNSELLLEEDLFKIKGKDLNNFKLLIVKHYFKNQKVDKQLYIYKNFLNGKIIRSDTLNINPFPCP
ncbi:MAG: hypothetical protein QM535_00380 [Limnohabitans sp.]|nr:hypothetical protein [Limnohabitans sp.]